MIFEPVWVSTLEHLSQYKVITADTATAIKRGGNYNVPDNFPQTRVSMFLGLAYSSPSPLIMVSNGVLNLSDNGLSYKAYPLRLKNNRVRNLNDELEFSISTNEILSLDRYLFVSPINKIFNISFARVHSTKEGFLEDFLICLGGQGLELEKIRKANEYLFSALSNMIKNGNSSG